MDQLLWMPIHLMRLKLNFSIDLFHFNYDEISQQNLVI